MEIKPYWVLVVGFLLLLVYVIVVVRGSTPWFSKSYRPGPSFWVQAGGGGNLRGVEGFTSETPIFTMFGVEWCGFCQKTKPMFLEMAGTESKVTIGGQDVLLRYVDPEKEPAAAAGYKVEGYPAFYLDHAGGRDMYDSNVRTPEAILAFVQKKLGL
jgi:thiol-disulfide isomerase/thioredoxin